MTDPFTRIHNDVLEGLMKADLSAETRIIFAVWRKTFGYQKTKDSISMSQFMEMTSLSRQTLYDALNNLIAKKIICRSGSMTWFCKDFMKLNVRKTVRTENRTVRKTVQGGTENRTLPVRKTVPTIERKETIQKKETLPLPNVINQAKIKKGATSHSNTSHSNTSHSIESHSKKGLYPCTPDEIHKIATDLNISVHDVRAKHDRIMDLIDTNEFKPKWGKTTYGVLRNWLRRDKEDGRLTPMSWEEQQVLQYESPKWQKTFAEMRETMKKMREGSP